jgi:hypothetical protein
MQTKFPSRVLIKIFDPDNIKYGYFEYKANPGFRYTKEDIRNILIKTMGDLKRSFPMLSYKIVPVKGFQYNFICTGMKSKEETKITIEGIL